MVRSLSGICQLLPILLVAQNVAVDPDFNSLDLGHGYGDGANAMVRTSAVQPDGKIIIGGIFTVYSGTPRNGIARLNADGSLDTGFEPGTGAGSVSSITLQPDGRIIIGGAFTSYNGTPRSRIARLNADGSLDTGFEPGTGTEGSQPIVASTALQPDGKVIIGGSFTSFNGTPRAGIARLNADGSLDTGFDPGTGVVGDFSATVYSTALQAEGKIIIGGGFASYNGTPRNCLARLNADGSLDPGFDPGTGTGDQYSPVETTALQPDGKIIIGGYFDSYNGTARNAMARVNANGSLDAGFDPGTGTGTYAPVHCTALQLDGKVIIGGDFDAYDGTPRKCIARLNANGSLDTGFDPGSGVVGGAIQIVNTTTLQPDGKIIIGGAFEGYNGTVQHEITRVHGNGSFDTSFYQESTGANEYVYTTELQPDGKIILAGAFTSYNGTLRNFIARLSNDGSLDTGFDTGSGADNDVYTTTLQPDGKIIIGGNFASYNGTPRQNIARLNTDGSLDAAFVPGTGTGGSTVATTTLQTNGKIIVGGSFNYYNGIPRSRIARVNANGSLDSSFDPGTGANNGVSNAALQPDGKIIIGGAFTSFNGTARNHIARLNTNGSLDTGFDPGAGVEGGFFPNVLTTALQPDGKIIIGGSFTSYNGTPRQNIARLNTDGSLDTTFDPGAGVADTSYSDVQSITLQPDGKIIIAGIFTSYDSIPRNHIARLNLDGSLDLTFDPGTAADNSLRTTALQPDGKIIIGGHFTSFNGNGRNRIARLIPDLTNHVASATATGWALWPNPTSGAVTIAGSGLSTAVSITITDISGRRILRLPLRSAAPGHTLELVGQPPGIYLVTVTSPTTTTTVRVSLE